MILFFFLYGPLILGNLGFLAVVECVGLNIIADPGNVPAYSFINTGKRRLNSRDSLSGVTLLSLMKSVTNRFVFSYSFISAVVGCVIAWI